MAGTRHASSNPSLNAALRYDGSEASREAAQVDIMTWFTNTATYLPGRGFLRAIRPCFPRHLCHSLSELYSPPAGA